MPQTAEQIRALRKKMQQMYPPIYHGERTEIESASKNSVGTTTAQVARPLGTHLTTLQDKVGMDDEETRRLMDEGVARTQSVEASAAEIEQLLRQKLKQKMAQRNATTQSLPTGVI